MSLAIRLGVQECFKREIIEAFLKRSEREPTPYEPWEELTESYRKRKIKRYGFDRIGVATEELLRAVESCKINYSGDQLRIQIPSDHYSKFAKKRPIVVVPSSTVLARYIAAALQSILT